MSKALTIAVPKFFQSPCVEVSVDVQWIEERDALLANCDKVTAVTTQAEYDSASRLLSSVTKTSNSAESKRKDLARPFADAASLIKSAVDGAREPLERAKDRLKSILTAFAVEQERRANAARLEAELKQQAEARAQLAQHEAASELGETKEGETFVPVVTPQYVEERKAHSSASAFVKRVEFEITDPETIPRALCSPDESKIRAWIKENDASIRARIVGAGGEGIQPGIKFVLNASVRSR